MAAGKCALLVRNYDIFLSRPGSLDFLAFCYPMEWMSRVVTVTIAKIVSCSCPSGKLYARAEIWVLTGAKSPYKAPLETYCRIWSEALLPIIL